MSLHPQEITIAVTVYNRRDYLEKSIGSALAQSIPVRVMVVEDCGPDPGLREYVHSLFGSRVGYFRSERRRGIFGNWNACIEQCQTRWLSILHDDDWLKPDFVKAMVELNHHAGDRGLYFGRTVVVDSDERPRPEWEKPPLRGP
jgi:glycosyltransferase involved in cell wall biosynthesis